MRRDATQVELIEHCRRASLELLQRNLTPQGILAALPTEAAVARRYTRIFGRDAAICALAMCGTGVEALERGAVASVDALAAQQAANGQIAKYVDAQGENADFWYIGCIDATLWWLIAADHVRRHSPIDGVASLWGAEVQRALAWLRAQEHPHFQLLQQNEASDWADIMPRSGYVLYTNALWYLVKRRFALPEPHVTREQFNHLFHPFRRGRPEYHRTRLLQHYARRGMRDPELYLSFVNLSGAGDEGDVFGNLLAILCNVASESMGQGIVRTLRTAHAAEPYPIRVVLHPLVQRDPLWRAYMGRHRQNHPHQYHNGGIWPFVGSFWVMALARLGRRERAWEALGHLAAVNALSDWRFSEWLHGRTLAPMGMPGQSWNAATFLLALRTLMGEKGAWSADGPPHL